VQAAVDETIKTFGGIDILVNNASAISLTGTLATPMKKYDLMNQINARGTYLCSRTILPHLMESKKKGRTPHILNISPPLSMKPVWFKNHTAYTMAKYGMSMCVLGMSAELEDSGIAVNALWPKTAIITAAMEMLGGDSVASQCRKPEIMADAAYAILTKESGFTGNFAIDDKILMEEGVSNFDQYAVSPGTPLILDFFLEDIDDNVVYDQHAEIAAASADTPSSKVANIFKAVESAITDKIVSETQAVFKFVVGGECDETWLVDLKSNGTVVKGDGESDVTMKMNDADFVDLFQGKLNSTAAFMQGKLQIEGNMMKAMQLEKLMGAMQKAAKESKKAPAASAPVTPEGPSSKISKVFKNVESAITDKIVSETNAVFKFVIGGECDETWLVDLKSNGTVVKGDGESDVTMKMNDADFVDLFQGKLNSTAAFMQGKLQIEGNMMKAMQLEKLMGAMQKSKL